MARSLMLIPTRKNSDYRNETPIGSEQVEEYGFYTSN